MQVIQFNQLKQARGGKLRCLRQLVPVIGFLMMISGTDGQTITNNNSSLTINTSSGVSSWLVDGVNQLNQRWFWYRIGNGGPESPIQSINASPTVTSPIPGRSLDITYANALLSVNVTYSLSGGAVGSDTGTITESVRVKNLTAGNLDLHFFQYADMNLINTAANQTVLFTQDIAGRRIATQSLGTKTVTERVTSGANPVAHFQADSTGQILAGLMDGVPTALTDVGSTGPAGDATYAFQWDAVLAPSGQPGESLATSTLITVVPEPSAFGVLSALASVYFFAASKKRNPVKAAHS